MKNSKNTIQLAADWHALESGLVKIAELAQVGGCPRLCVTGLPSDTVASDRRHHEQGQTPHQRRAA